MEYPHENNVYAHDLQNRVRHISEVASGKRGYYCMGCTREMQAKKGERYAHHFAHDPTDVENKGKCSYSDETYRHELAKDTLQYIKQIKVPALYKYPPAGSEGKPYKLQDARVIEAYRVEIEMPFYEKEDGTVAWGRNWQEGERTDRHLLIQPDAAFFNAQGEPILLIELVATHKVDAEKLVKIRRLGLDVVQVSVPKESSQEIENAFYTTVRTEWLHNNEQEQAPYLRVSEGSDEGVPPVDEFQRKLLKTAESYACRASQIGNLLRAIGKCVDSQQYRDSQQYIVGEIRRVEDNATRVNREFREAEARYTAEAQAELRLETECLDTAGASLKDREREFRHHATNLEDRYFSKSGSLFSAQANYRPECQSEIDRIEGDLAELGASGGTLGEREAEISAEADRFERHFSLTQDGLERAAAAEHHEADRIAEAGAGLPAKYEGIEAGVRAELEAREAELRVEHEASAARGREDFERDRRDLLAAIESRDFGAAPGISRRVKDVHEAGRVLIVIDEEIALVRRLRKAKAVFDAGTFKSWQ